MDATVTLFGQVSDHLKARPVRDVTETDGLSPERLSQQVRQQLVSHPDLAEPCATVTNLQEKLQWLRELRGKRPSKLLRDVDAIVSSVIDPVVDRIRLAIESAIGEAPHRGPEIIQQVRCVLSALVIPEPDAEPLNRLGRLTRALGELNQRRLGLPRKSIEYAEQRLTERALPEYDATIQALAAERVSEYLKQQLHRLDEFCGECLTRVGRFQQNIARIQATVFTLRTASVTADHVSKSSVVLELPGPAEDDVIAGLRSRLRCSDQNELSGILLVRWVDLLRPHAERWVSDLAPLGVLLTYVDPERAAGEFARLVESLLGEGHSLYEIIERFGVLKVASELVNRAEQLCSLQSRDLEPFNVTPLTLTIVRLPPAAGPRDLQIRDQLEAAFLEATGNKCLRLSCSPAERNAITVVRSKTGFPIGIEGGNETLLLEYMKAADAGHLPHLVGVISTTDHGEALPNYLTLAHQLSSEHSQNLFSVD